MGGGSGEEGLVERAGVGGGSGEVGVGRGSRGGRRVCVGERVEREEKVS